jgi:hypothetical protein
MIKLTFYVLLMVSLEKERRNGKEIVLTSTGKKRLAA